MKLGIFGLIGSGKSTVVDYLKNHYNFEVLDLDKISKLIMQHDEIVAFIRNTLPEAYEVKTQEVNRSKLRELLFTNKKLNKEFARFVWPKIGLSVNQILKSLPIKKNVVIEGAILPALNLELDKMILIEARKKTIVSRVLLRDERDVLETKALIKIQKHWLRKADFDILIKNDTTIVDLKAKLDKLMTKYAIKKCTSQN